MNIFRVYVEKKEGFNLEAKKLIEEIVEFLHISTVSNVRVLRRYDIEGISEEVYKKALNTVLSEPPVDVIYEEEFKYSEEMVFATSFLPGQYDQLAESCNEGIRMIQSDLNPITKTAKVYVLEGNLSQEEIQRIKNYIINPVESEEVALTKPNTLKSEFGEPKDVAIIDGFIKLNNEELAKFHQDEGLAMNLKDLEYFQSYFVSENRDPSYTEIKVVDTYWSDHCRHTTFMTKLNQIEIEKSEHSAPIEAALESYRQARKRVYGDNAKPETLMDIATIQTKDLKKQDKLPGVVFSAEINACTIEETIKVDNKDEDWLVLFKNETHNHPTEIEPYGGAATCLGGAIRDPLSGRAYVYQAMRVTGSADPNEKIEDTLEGKLPQRVITKTAANGYSSYGNQIGIAAGELREYYHEGFKAKRMELGAVVGAVKSDSVKREEPKPGDIVLMIGGRTGRDGCGGATGSSKEQTEDALMQCGSEVQKGDPAEERKIQRLFRNPEFTKRIKRCNDFGAGGVCVAIGELADGLKINLDLVNLKYPGLDGTEIAISESQERMAIVIDSEDEQIMKELCDSENLEVAAVATVTEEKRLIITWRDKEIVNISRNFLDSAGVESEASGYITAPTIIDDAKELTKANVLYTLADLNVGLQKGIATQFDSTVGSATVLMPYGGKTQLTKELGMVAKLPVLEGETDAATYMTHGFDPYVSSASPFHGAMYAVVESIAKLVAIGGDYKKAYLSFQEYFERLGEDKEKWGKPVSALLGALMAKQNLGLAAIGGKDSMSGTFNDISVPPTLVSFTCMVGSAKECVSASFKKENHALMYLQIDRDENNIPDFEQMKLGYDLIYKNVAKGKIYSSYAIGKGGLVAAISNMSIGNEIGCEVFDPEILGLPNAFSAAYGDIIVEVDFEDVEELADAGLIHIGETNVQPFITIGDMNIYIEEIIESIKKPLANVFELEKDSHGETVNISYPNKNIFVAKNKIKAPKVIIPVFPGTTGEYDTERAFEKAGAEVEQVLFLTRTKNQIDESIKNLAEKIKQAQIVALVGGFSLGNEPDGSGKTIAAILRNPVLERALMNHLYEEDGLLMGISNGFQVLVKLGLLPFGEIKTMNEQSPVITHNHIGKHVSTLAKTKITSVNSPWLSNVSLGEIYEVPVSHSEGRFVASNEILQSLVDNGQIFSQYVNEQGIATPVGNVNPNGSMYNIEGLISKDGRIIGKMGHSERKGDNIHKNVPGKKDQRIFEAGVNYYK